MCMQPCLSTCPLERQFIRVESKHDGASLIYILTMLDLVYDELRIKNTPLTKKSFINTTYIVKKQYI